jgi:molybdopterin-containing oxidoreductase family membrane subunit
MTTHDLQRQYASIGGRIAALPLRRRTGRGWLLGFAIAFLLLMGGMWSVTILLVRGVGVWGINIPVGWAFAIINFVWWIGIGHAGTLISAILLLLRQDWRTSINRFAEAMTLFAVACAGLFPLLHLGRIWKFYFLFPYPDTLGLWPQWRSPLVWDVFAVATYGTVSLLFWYVGLIPDLATLRDSAKRKWPRVAYAVLAMGWRGSAAHWRRHQIAYLLLAGLATPLVVSVHSVVSLDFAVGIVPGWHSTIFPPYFVAGAIYAGFAMVLLLCIPLRAIYGFHDFITDKHLDNMAKVMLTTGLIVAYGYLMELFMSWYGANTFEQYLTQNRFFGPYAWTYWSLVACNVVIPQLLWLKRVRRSPVMLFIIALVISLGMWIERFVIIVTSLHRDFLPSAWGKYNPTIYDYALLFGTVGLFVCLIFLFVRLLPAISIYEMREAAWERSHEGEPESVPAVPSTGGEA